MPQGNNDALTVSGHCAIFLNHRQHTACFALCLLARASYEPNITAMVTRARVDTRLILYWTARSMMTMVMKQLPAMSRWRLFHQQKLFMSPPTSFASRPPPSPPVVEREDPTEVDWEAALPPRDRWPADLGDLYADNPAGARTWSEVEAAMQQLVIYHAVRDMSRILSVMVLHASARARERTQRTLPTVHRRCRCLLPLQTKLG